MPFDIKVHRSTRIGRRDTNEDVEVINLNMKTDGSAVNDIYAPVDIFIICDGHGGINVAKFASLELENELTNKDLIYPLFQNEVIGIFNRIQHKLAHHSSNIARACGCTVLAVIRFTKNGNKFVQVINIGDTRAVLSRDGIAVPLTKDHKPFWPDEKRRIEQVNKRIGRNEQIHFDAGDWRIRDLSVSRSFGDLDNTPYVTHIPEIYCYPLFPKDEFIVMACDGVYDVLENHEVVNFVRDYWDNNHTNLYNIRNRFPPYPFVPGDKKKGNIAGLLAEYAIAKGSTDNVSVIVLFFS